MFYYKYFPFFLFSFLLFFNNTSTNEVYKQADSESIEKKTIINDPYSSTDDDIRVSKVGLHVTQQELEIWRKRALSGPYRQSGDAGINSPGDWNRIQKNAIAFLAQPYKEIFTGDTTPGCVRKHSKEPVYEGIKLRDAAFVYLITNNKIYLQKVKEVLLLQASNPWTDFSRKDRWCDDIFRDVGPGFKIAEWLIKLLFAYDYVKDGLNPAEKLILNQWFRNAAYFFNRNLNNDLNKLFKDRSKEDYAFTSYSKGVHVSNQRSLTHSAGWKISSLAKWYNNRRGSIARFIAFAGVFLEDPQLKLTGKMFVKEWLKFSVYPDGTVGEFERSKPDFPDLGWCYATYIISQAMEIADVFARDGDPELYKYKTSEGCFGTQGGNKTILLTINTILGYLDGTIVRHAPNTLPNLDSRIDGIVKEKHWYTVNDVWFCLGNIYYKSDYIKNNYLRKAKNRLPYPTPVNTASMGPHQPWSGLWAAYPGVLFMFGQMEGEDWPYGDKLSNR